MWFKQIQFFQINSANGYSAEALEAQLAPYIFKPCLPSMASTQGWCAPVGQADDAPLVHSANNHLLFCLKIADKVLPATIVRQELEDKVLDIQTKQERKVGQKEKQRLRDEITHTLLPRAFTKFTKIYAYIDIKNNWLVLNTANAAKTELFITMLKKALPTTIVIKPFALKLMAPIMTRWLLEDSTPALLSIEKAAVLQDPQQKNRSIRCQQQDLFANAILSLVKEGYQVKQLALNWQGHIDFTLSDEFLLRGISYGDSLLTEAKDSYTETVEQQFDTDFVLMAESLKSLFLMLVREFTKEEEVLVESEEVALEGVE